MGEAVQSRISHQPKRILVIKLGALGDIVQSLGPMAAIRNHHPDAHITVLTTPPYEALMMASGYVDEIWLDKRPRWSELGVWLELRKRLRMAGFYRVYDLQTSDRSSFYRRLFWPDPYPEWSGIAKGCSHPHTNLDRDNMHTIDRQADQLFDAGIELVPSPDLSWADSDTSRFDLTEPFCLLVPGGAPHRPDKRWPAEHYADVTRHITDMNATPALLGANAEMDLLAAISDACPSARNLCGQTSFLDLAALARRAAGAVGNDTGPMHLLAAVGCPSIVLFSDDSNPMLCAPRGQSVNVLQQSSLKDLPVKTVMDALLETAPDLPPLTPASTA